MVHAAAIIVLSGEIGQGKTTALSEVVTVARKQGLRVCGLLTHAVVCNGQRVGLDVEDVRSGQRQRLAAARPPAAPPVTRTEEGPTTKGWQFYRAALDWGVRALQSALPCDLLVIDEIGPLELVRDDGWPQAMDVLREGEYRTAVVVVRPSLVHAFTVMLPGASISVLMLTPANRASIPAEVLAYL